MWAGELMPGPASMLGDMDCWKYKETRGYYNSLISVMYIEIKQGQTLAWSDF